MASYTQEDISMKAHSLQCFSSLVLGLVALIGILVITYSYPTYAAALVSAPSLREALFLSSFTAYSSTSPVHFGLIHHFAGEFAPADGYASLVRTLDPCNCLTNVDIDGPLTGSVGITVSVTATVSPPTATLPITYTWQATGQSDVVQVKHSTQTSVGFTWAVTGTKTITVTAINQCGQVSSLPHTIQVVTPWYVYLPFVARTAPYCPGNVLINGDFEQGHTGWYTYTTGSGWKQHDLIGSDAEGFHPYRGHYAARLGGYEGVWDAITQTVVIPVQGQLTYWWKGRTYETLPHHDTFEVALLNQDGTLVASLAYHDDQDVQDTWQQDVVDVSAYAGQSLTLRFSSYNDNYYFTVFHLDEICLSSVSSR
jgi:hypothetical protein